MDNEATFEGWAILEMMGHRRLAGEVTEATVGGAGRVRLDVPGNPAATQFYPPSAVYCLTPTTEEIALAVAARNQPAPVQRWELPKPIDVPSSPDDGLEEPPEWAFERRDDDDDDARL